MELSKELRKKEYKKFRDTYFLPSAWESSDYVPSSDDVPSSYYVPLSDEEIEILERRERELAEKEEAIMEIEMAALKAEALLRKVQYEIEAKEEEDIKRENAAFAAEDLERQNAAAEEKARKEKDAEFLLRMGGYTEIYEALRHLSNPIKCNKDVFTLIYAEDGERTLEHYATLKGAHRFYEDSLYDNPQQEGTISLDLKLSESNTNIACRKMYLKNDSLPKIRRCECWWETLYV
jgi:hypothetical protein